MGDSQHEERSISVRRWLERLDPYLKPSDVTEIAINDCKAIFVMKNGEWVRHEGGISFRDLMHFARLVSTYTTSPLSEETPCLSGYLPNGERVEIGIPPSSMKETVAINIRKHSTRVINFETFISQGYFENTKHVFSTEINQEKRIELVKHLSDVEQECWALAQASNWSAFLKTAVREKLNTIIAGSTGTGKTAFMRALIEFIPKEERLGVSQDVHELMLNQPNVIYRFFKKAGSKSGATVEETMMAFMRSTISRLIQSEIRGPEAFYYLMSVLNSGHPGGLTSIHANSANDTFLRLALLIKSSNEGRGLELKEIKTMLNQLVHVVVQLVYIPGVGRRVPTIYYDPMKALMVSD